MFRDILMNQGVCMRAVGATIICAPRISQIAALAALTAEPVHIPGFEQILARRRSLICARLDRVPHVFQYTKPEGAYYIMADFGDLGFEGDDVAFSRHLIENVGVAPVPGSSWM